MMRGMVLMGMFDRISELVTNPEGRLSTTDTISLTALCVSSVALLLCVVLNREPDVALGFYLGAWVTHSGVQVHQKIKAVGAGKTPPPQERPDERSR